MKKRKVSRGQKLPARIIQLIQSKNTFARTVASAKISGSPDQIKALSEQLHRMKQEVKEAITELKLHRRQRLRNRILHQDPTRKKFWRFVKKHAQSVGNISAVLNADGRMVFNLDEIDEAVMNHFSNIFNGERSPPISAKPTPPSQLDAIMTEMQQIIDGDISYEPDAFEEVVCSGYTFSELDSELQKLPSEKACGMWLSDPCFLWGLFPYSYSKSLKQLC